MIRYTIKLLALLLVTVAGWGETAESYFQRGVESYRKEDWQGAISSWQEIEHSGSSSGHLYYNLGNAFYRAGIIGIAIIYYERARELMPRDRDVQQNLELARMATVDRIERPVRLIVWDWVDRARDFFSLRELLLLVRVLGIVAAIAVALWIFRPSSLRKGLRVAMSGLIALYVLGLGWYAWRSVLDSNVLAVVVETKVDVFSAPDSAATQVFTLHEGTELTQRETVAGWIHVDLSDGRSGWLPATAVEQI